jgi:hypothetical protein
MGDPRLDDAIERLADLPAGWDSYGAPPIERAVLDRAKRSLAEIEYRLAPWYIPPTVGPDVDGGVELIWRGHWTAVHVLVGAGDRFKVLVLRGEVPVGPAQMKTLGEVIDLLKTHLQQR